MPNKESSITRRRRKRKQSKCAPTLESPIPPRLPLPPYAYRPQHTPGHPSIINPAFTWFVLCSCVSVRVYGGGNIFLASTMSRSSSSAISPDNSGISYNTRCMKVRKKCGAATPRHAMPRHAMPAHAGHHVDHGIPWSYEYHPSSHHEEYRIPTTPHTHHTDHTVRAWNEWQSVEKGYLCTW